MVCYSSIQHNLPWDEKEYWYGEVYGKSGKPFIIFNKYIWTIKGRAATFMHELGHNMDLEHPPFTYLYGIQVPSNAKTAMQRSVFDTLDYHPNEWEIVYNNINP